MVVAGCVLFTLLTLGAISEGGRRRAKEIVCQLNLRQWHTVFQGYIEENEGKFLSGCNQKDAARVLGVSEAMVSQLLRDVQDRIRQAVAARFRDASGVGWPDADRLWAALTRMLKKNDQIELSAEEQGPPGNLPGRKAASHDRA